MSEDKPEYAPKTTATPEDAEALRENIRQRRAFVNADEAKNVLRLDRIITLLEKQNELLEALVAAEYLAAEHNERLVKGLVEGGNTSGVEAYTNQRLLGGEGSRRRRGV